MSRGLWRKGVAALNLTAAPYDLEFNGHRPVRLLRDAGFEVHTVSRGDSTERRAADGVTAWVEHGTVNAARRIARLRPELLFVDSSTYGALLGALGRRSWIRNPQPAVDPRLYRLQRAALRSFDAVSFTNPADMARWESGAERNVELLYPIDVDWWAEPVARRDSWWTDRGWPVPDGPVLVCVASYTRGKRHAEMIRALAPYLTANPSVVLALVGHPYAEPDVAEMVRGLPRALGIADQVRVSGWVSSAEIRDLFAWASLSIINSNRETQCMAVYEALAAGVPTLISAIPNLTSQWPNLPAHADDRELRANVERLLGDPELGRAVVASSRERVGWADIRRHDEAFYMTVEQLLGRDSA